MIEMIAKTELEKYYKKLPIKYDQYINWLDEEENIIPYYGIATRNIDIRLENEWNKKGREIYAVNKLIVHAEKIGELINLLKLSEFIVQHEYMTWKWFPEHIIKNKSSHNKINYIKSKFSGIELSIFDGGFRIKGVKELIDFIKVFIDYPFLLKYRDIDMLSMDLDLVIKINHHLDICFLSSDINLIRKVILYCEQITLHFEMYYETYKILSQKIN